MESVLPHVYRVTKFDPADRAVHDHYVDAQEATSDRGKYEAAYIQAVAAPRVRGDGSPGPVHVDLVRRLLPRARRGGPPPPSMYRNGFGFFLYTLGWSLRPARSEGVLALES
ncbi:hypothetical protein ABT169_19270 [Streptomyces sp. NPDC001616]|uniref:hypothetical protein n=1 Tax=Streptomyces sp. NPDC001616 TaxID=3156648 RepID=UPI00331D650C